MTPSRHTRSSSPSKAECLQSTRSSKLRSPIRTPTSLSSADTTHGKASKSSVVPYHHGLSNSHNPLPLSSRASLNRKSPNCTDPRAHFHNQKNPLGSSTHSKTANPDTSLPSSRGSTRDQVGVSRHRLQTFSHASEHLPDHPQVRTCQSSENFISRLDDRPPHSRRSAHSIRDPFVPTADSQAYCYAHDSYSTLSLDAHVHETRMKQDFPALRPFHPSSQPIDSEHRPKTSRGFVADYTMLGQVSSHTSAQLHGTSDTSPMRRSAFAEGSMNGKSRGVASSWLDLEPAAGSDSHFGTNNSDGTPRASVSQDDSIDLRDFKPLPLTPSRLKDTLRHFGWKPKASAREESTCPSISTTTSRSQKQPRSAFGRGLSTLNLLSEKLRSLGNSNTLARDVKNNSNTQLDQHNILAERKRKADEAYATQFGFKKQRDNYGLATITSAAVEREQEAPATMRRKIPADNATVRAHPRARARGPPPSAIDRFTSLQGDHAMLIPSPQSCQEVEKLDHRKRPTRAELEKENQQLRALLRDATMSRQSLVHRPSSAMSMHSNKSSVHLPAEGLVDSVETTNSFGPHLDQFQDSSNHTASMKISPNASPNNGKRRLRSDSNGTAKHRGAGIPPVPALPSQIPNRNILAPVTGNVARSPTRNLADTKSEKSHDKSGVFKLSNKTVLRDASQSPTRFKIKGSRTSTGVAKQELRDRNSNKLPIMQDVVPILLPPTVPGDENMNTEQVQFIEKTSHPKGDFTLDTDCSGIEDPIKREEKWVWPDDVF